MFTTNLALQPKKIARGLKLWIHKVEGSYLSVRTKFSATYFQTFEIFTIDHIRLKNSVHVANTHFSFC